MNKLLVICGPTATGKTSLAVRLAKKFNGEIISADSRQVYRKMDIGTGKEWSDEIKIYGYDLVNPDEEFNISEYMKFAIPQINEIQKKGKLPILTGGTGLYIKGVVDGIPTIGVPQNLSLRENLKSKNPEELYEILSNLDPLKAGSMNSSDRKNSRRLSRAIEIATWRLEHGSIDSERRKIYPSVLFVGLTAKLDVLEKRISERVKKRVGEGMKGEVEKLLKNGISWDYQSMYSLGYRQYRDYFEGGVDEESVMDEWTREEKQYARRQLTWFKRDERINWFNISTSEYPENVENLVQKWYTQSDAEES